MIRVKSMIYNIHYDICAMIISLFSILFVIVKKGFKKKQNIILFALLVASFIAAAFDVTSSVLNSYVDSCSYGIRDFFNIGYFSIQNSMPILSCNYIITLTGLDFGKRRNKWFYFFLSIPLILDYLLIFTTRFTNMVYFYDSQKIYTHGLGMNFLYVVAVIYMCMNYYFIIRYGKGVPFGKKLMVYLFLSASLLVVLVQMVFPHLLLQLCIESLCLLGVLFTVDNEDEITEYVTGCYNRRVFINQSSLYIKNQIEYYVVVLKLTNLDFYTGTMGIENLNGFIHKVGGWIKKLDKRQEVFYCDHGRFAIICDCEDKMLEMEKKIAERFETNWEYDGILLKFKTQLWTANVPKDIQSVNQMILVLDADVQDAAFKNQQSYKGKEELYGYRREIAVEAAIQRALEHGNFEVYFQPIWNSKVNKITSAEALLRLKDDILGNISPDEFIPLAEKKGYIFEIGAFVFEKVCQFYTEKSLDQIGIEYIELNLSTLQCMSEELIQTFQTIVSKYNIDTRRINLEITESAMANSLEILEHTMTKLREKGFTFSMDDYGTGYSNLSNIFNMPFQMIKVDKSILWKAMENEKAGIILSTTIRMVHEMKMEVVVEGVETNEQKELLQNLKCDYLQGYYFSKAVPAEEFYRYCVGFNLT